MKDDTINILYNAWESDFYDSPLIPLLVELFAKLEEYNVKTCIYGHLHGYGHNMIKEGTIGNIDYKFVGCDYTGFKLIKLSE